MLIETKRGGWGEESKDFLGKLKKGEREEKKELFVIFLWNQHKPTVWLSRDERRNKEEDAPFLGNILGNF